MSEKNHENNAAENSAEMPANEAPQALSPEEILQQNSQAKILSAQIFASNLDKFINKNIVAFCGIAYPQKFFDFVKNIGLNLVETNIFADHYNYKNEDLERLYQESLAKNLKLITTKKDWVKFPKNFQEKIDYLDIKLDFDDQILVKNLLEKIITK